MAVFDSNDKKIEAGTRTAFHVYLDSSTLSKSQTVPFPCRLKKLSIFFDADCDWLILGKVSIDSKEIVKARGDNVKLTFSLDEPIDPNSEVEFDISVISGAPTNFQVTMYGDVCGKC